MEALSTALLISYGNAETTLWQDWDNTDNTNNTEANTETILL